MDFERALHKNSHGRGSEAHFEHGETLCGCLLGLTEITQILSNVVTFEVRPLCNMTRCTALWKSDIPIKIRHYDC